MSSDNPLIQRYVGHLSDRYVPWNLDMGGAPWAGELVRCILQALVVEYVRLVATDVFGPPGLGFRVHNVIALHRQVGLHCDDRKGERLCFGPIARKMLGKISKNRVCCTQFGAAEGRIRAYGTCTGGICLHSNAWD